MAMNEMSATGGETRLSKKKKEKERCSIRENPVAAARSSQVSLGGPASVWLERRREDE